MKTLAAIGSRLAAVQLVALPAMVLAQAPIQQPAPPGGASGAWPLGIIVLLVALMFVFGTYMARKSSNPSRGGRPPGLE